MNEALSTRLSAPVVEGEVLAGKYEVARLLGAGGMGVVVEARHVQLGQRVALKFLLSDECRSKEAIGRFLREGRAAVRIKSEHVARVTDVGTLENGAPFIVMEYLEGEDLSNILARRGALFVTEAVDYVLQAAEAIAEAHSLGIIHRDLKPANLFLTQRADGSPLIKVLDFGISKIDNDPQQVSLTASTGALGSPQYMSPEQMRSAKYVDHRTDIWAVGAILFELLAGHPPFQADSLIGLCTLVATKEAPRLRDVVRDAPEGLSRVISKCLERELDNRYDTLAQLAVELMPFGSSSARTSSHRIVTILKDAGMADAVPLPSDPPTRSHDPNTDTVAIGQTADIQRKRTRGPLIALIGGLAVATFLLTAWAVRTKSSHAPAAVPLDPAEAVSGIVDAAMAPTPTEYGDAASVRDAPFDGGDASSVTPASSGATSPTPLARSTSSKRRVSSTPPAKTSSEKSPPAPSSTKTSKLPDFGGRNY